MVHPKSQYTVSEAQQALDHILDRTQTGERVPIVRGGKVIAYVVPSAPVERVGCMKDTITILGDLSSTGEVWDVEQ